MLLLSTTLTLAVSLHHHAGSASCCFWLINLPSLLAGNSCCNAVTVHCTTTLSPGMSGCCQFLLFLPLAQQLQFHLCRLQCNTVKLHHHAGAAPHGQSIHITPDAIPRGAKTTHNCTTTSYPALPCMCNLMLLLLCVSVTHPSPGVLLFSFIIVVFY